MRIVSKNDCFDCNQAIYFTHLRNWQTSKNKDNLDVLSLRCSLPKNPILLSNRGGGNTNLAGKVSTANLRASDPAKGRIGYLGFRCVSNSWK